jgi:FkbM family methyltransferase
MIAVKRVLPESLKRAVRIAFAPALPMRGRLQLLTVERRLHRGRHRQGQSDAEVDLGVGRAILSSSDLYIDYVTFFGIFVDRLFDTDYANMHVIDLGAHCGYYGAYALGRGAACVYSYEPHSGNYQRLTRCAETFHTHGRCWVTDRCAVGSHDGVVALNVSSQSWSHSLYTPMTGEAIGVEHVDLRSFSSILNTVRRTAGDAPIFVKINVEGAAGDVILGTSVDEWRDVSGVMFDCEPNGPHEPGQLIDHLRQAGFTPLPARGRLYWLGRLKPADE